MRIILDFNRFGPWALVTGASSGIGKEFARQLAANGLNLVLVARREALLKALGDELAKQYGISYQVIGVDLSEKESINTIMQSTESLNIGLVISNAGTGTPGKFLHQPLNELEDAVQLNVMSHLAICHHFGKRLAQRKRGGIILVGAFGASQGIPFMSNDAATKTYVYVLGKGLHMELKKENVHVTVLLPGSTDTPVIQKLGFKPHQLPMKPMSVQQCVAETLRAHTTNRSTIIPGRINRIMNTLLPAGFASRMMGKMLVKANGFQ